MNHIIKFAAVMIMVLAPPAIAAAHMGSVAPDAYLHGAAHGLEIFIAFLIAYLGYRCWRKFYR